MRSPGDMKILIMIIAVEYSIGYIYLFMGEWEYLRTYHVSLAAVRYKRRCVSVTIAQ